MDINLVKIRDTIAYHVMNFVMNTVASKEYRENLQYLMDAGVVELERQKSVNKTRAMLSGTNEETR